MAEATIDELRIEVEAESEQAANGLEKLIQKLDRLKAATAGVTENNGLAKIKSQLNKLVKTAQQLQNLSGFDKITQLVNALRSLNGLGSINTERVDTVVASMRRLRNVVEQVNAMPNIDTAKFQQLADALQPFAGANTQGFAEFLKSLQKLPKVAEKLDAMDFGRFADQMQQLAQAVGPVVTEFERMARAFEQMPDFVRQFIVNINAASNAADNASNSNRNLNKTLGNIKVKTAAAIAALSKLIDKLGDCVNTSNQFVENLNLFKVTMGDSADEAYKFAEAVNDAMGIDTSDWVRYQGFFQSIGKGFGIASDKADLMSQNLTQLSYDLSSFYNTSVDEAYNKVVSGISGRHTCPLTEESVLKQSLNSVKSKLLAAA